MSKWNTAKVATMKFAFNTVTPNRQHPIDTIDPIDNTQ